MGEEDGFLPLIVIIRKEGKGMDGEKRLRVYNECRYDIGVRLVNGQTLNIRTGSFQILSVNDILFIESICTGKKFFSSGMLTIRDDSNKVLTLEEVGGYTDDYTEKHVSDEEISAMLKKPAKQIEAWLNNIDDPVELHAIGVCAKEMDLPSSKLKILKAKLPNTDFLEDAE